MPIINQEIPSEKINTFFILPHSPNTILTNTTDLKKILQLKKYLVSEMIFAIEMFFIKKNLAIFDAHVGDTLCQIRASMLLDLLADNKKNFESINQLGELKSLANKLERAILNLDSKLHQPKLIDYLFKNQLTIEVEKLTLFLTQCRFLSQFKKKDSIGNLSINYKQISESIGFTKSLIRKLVHYFQINLADLSTDYILQICSSSHCPSNLRDLILFDEEQRRVTPCYWTMKTIYQNLLARKHPILLIVHKKINNITVDTIKFFFKISPINDKYVYFQNPPLEYLNKSALIFEGEAQFNRFESVTSYKKRLLLFSLYDLLFSNMAIHPQYSGIKLDPFNTDTYQIFKPEFQKEYLEYIEMAKEIGCCLDNPTLFFIRHIYAGLVHDHYSVSNDRLNNINQSYLSIG